jgi:four helix bundle protein
LARASASIGANYIEANEALSKKDFRMRIKISRKESRESRFFLRLLDIDDVESDQFRQSLSDEAEELRLILSSILNNSKDSATTSFNI